MTTPLPEWADEWAPGVTSCGKRAVRCWATAGGDVTACAVTGWGIEKCAEGPR